MRKIVNPDRVKRTVQVRNLKGEWIETTGIFPDEWLCTRPGCNRLTKSYTRNIGRHRGHRPYCSRECKDQDYGRIKTKDPIPCIRGVPEKNFKV